MARRRWSRAFAMVSLEIAWLTGILSANELVLSGALPWQIDQHSSTG